MSRAKADAAFRAAVKEFIAAHDRDEGGDPMQSGHGGLITESTKAKEAVKLALDALEAWDGVIEVIDTNVPPNIREHEGELVVELYAGTLTMRAPVGEGDWFSRKARVTLKDDPDYWRRV
jgi:hypothetical protein